MPDPVDLLTRPTTDTFPLLRAPGNSAMPAPQGYRRFYSPLRYTAGFPPVACNPELTIMKKQKRPSPEKSVTSEDGQNEAALRNLVGLALDLTGLDDYASLPDDLKKKKNDLRKMIRKCLHQKKDAMLSEALERTYEEDGNAYALLREGLEEDSETIVFRRDEGPDAASRRHAGEASSRRAFARGRPIVGWNVGCTRYNGTRRNARGHHGA